MISILTDGDVGAPDFVFAHGAGAAMDTEFMNTIARGLADNGIRVHRFEFPYMQQMRATGKRRPPERAPKLLVHYQQVLDQLQLQSPVIGGKSMGGRMSTLLATERDFAGVVVLGYPFHAIGKPEKVRIDHLQDIRAPVLICQGERDAMGSAADVAQYRMPKAINIHWFADGDHDLKPRKSSGYSHAEHLQDAIVRVSRFIHAVSST